MLTQIYTTKQKQITKKKAINSACVICTDNLKAK